tara:strand:+ start:91460 stop:92683 length:1224 start_codon:yes stop_codon:yes gene_type:complete
MNILYSIFLFILDISIFISSKFNEKNRRIFEGRKNSFQYILDNNITEEKIIWIHVSSVGEFEQAKPIIERIKFNYQYKALVTYFSSSAEETVSEYKEVDYHFFLPSDRKKYMEKLFSLLKPKVIVLIKYEFWKNLIDLAYNNSIPVISISSIFRKNQIYFYPFNFFRNILRKISLFLVQNNESLELLNKINVENVKVVGDTRYDRVLEIFNNFKEDKKIKEFIDGKKTVIIGSSWRSDIEKIKNEIVRDLTDTKYIIAPHNINSQEIEYLENTFLNDTIKYSQLPQKNIKKRVLLIDNYGMLSSVYKYAKVSFIGGGFRGALHNTLEAVVWDVPVVYGSHSNNKKFLEVKLLEKNNIGFPIKSGNEFKLIKNRIFKNRDIGKGGNEFIKLQSGASDKINSYISKFLK